MPPELLNAVMNWGPLAVILFGILYRADQATRALVPVIIEHFRKLGEAMDAMRAAVANLTTLTTTVGAIGARLDEGIMDSQGDRADLSEDAKHIRQGVDELLIYARRNTDREAS